MHRIIVLTFAFAISTFAAETPASDASIRELLQVTDARKLIDGIFSQVESMLKTSMQQALKGHTPSPAEQIAIDTMRNKALEIMRDELSWEKLESIYLRIYQRSFSQEEMDGMLAFYRTPAGTAMIKKLPIVMQETMASMQQMIGPMMQRIQGLVKETVEELQAQKSKSG